MHDENYIELDEAWEDGDPASGFIERLNSYIESHQKPEVDSDPVSLQALPCFEEAYNLTLGQLSATPTDFWDSLVCLTNDKGEPFVRWCDYGPGEKIIRDGENTPTIYWLLEGEADVYARIDGDPHKVNSYLGVGACFGELAVLLGAARNADVIASQARGAKVIEIDWGITAISSLPELSAFFHTLAAKTVAAKLENSYHKPVSIAKKALSTIHEAKRESDRLRHEYVRLTDAVNKLGLDESEFIKIDPDQVIDHLVDNLRDLLLALRKRH